MVANNSAGCVHFLAGRYPGGIGHLYSPGGERGPYDWLPYALDNGAFGAFRTGAAFNADRWRRLLQWAATRIQSGAAPPLWVLVPDVVANAEATLEAWERYAPEATAYGWPLAFAAQDGHCAEDVPEAGAVVFLGGSTTWKRRAIRPWCARFPRVHVGRINGYHGLRYCAAAGAESCDGTGWLRGDQRQLGGLRRFLAEQAGEVEAVIQEELI